MLQEIFVDLVKLPLERMFVIMYTIPLINETSVKPPVPTLFVSDKRRDSYGHILNNLLRLLK